MGLGGLRRVGGPVLDSGPARPLDQLVRWGTGDLGQILRPGPRPPRSPTRPRDPEKKPPGGRLRRPREIILGPRTAHGPPVDQLTARNDRDRRGLGWISRGPGQLIVKDGGKMGPRACREGACGPVGRQRPAVGPGEDGANKFGPVEGAAGPARRDDDQLVEDLGDRERTDPGDRGDAGKRDDSQLIRRAGPGEMVKNQDGGGSRSGPAGEGRGA